MSEIVHTYNQDGVEAVITTIFPTMGSASIRQLCIEVLYKPGQTGQLAGYIFVYADLLKYTKSITGFEVPLPKWNSTEAEIQTCFEAMFNLPESFVDFGMR